MTIIKRGKNYLHLDSDIIEDESLGQLLSEQMQLIDRNKLICIIPLKHSNLDKSFI